MTDIQDLRARVRETRYEPERKSALPFWLITAAAVGIGFAGVMFAPRFFGGQRTVLVTHTETSAPAPAAAAPALPGAERYAGKSAEEVAKLADAFCAQRTGSNLLAPLSGAERSPKAKAEFDRAKQIFDSGGNAPDQNDQLACQLTEVPARYCSRSLRLKLTANVIDYFKGIETTNTSLRMMHKAQAIISLDRSRGNADGPLGSFTADPKVIDGVEGLIRTGYLLKPQRDDIGTSVPRPIKERLDRVVGNKTHCPETPWWAFWR